MAANVSVSNVTNRKARNIPNMVMSALVQSVRPPGGIGVVGVYVPEDLKGAFNLGKFFERGLFP